MRELLRRYTAGPARVGVRRGDDGKPRIGGYASVFHRADDPATEYWLWPGEVVERIMPTAFDRAIKEDDVRALFNHDPSRVLGRNRAGTLRLKVDATGLDYEADPPESAADVVESIDRGDVTGSSFGFFPDETVYREEKRADLGDKVVTVIERHSVALFDVSPVTFPAYEGASVGLRSLSDPEAARREVEAARASGMLGKLVRRPSRSLILAHARAVELAREARRRAGK